MRSPMKKLYHFTSSPATSSKTSNPHWSNLEVCMKIWKEIITGEEWLLGELEEQKHTEEKL